MAGISGLLSGVYGSDKEIYGEKPIVPPAPDYMAEMSKTIKGNIGLVPSLTELATKSTKLYSDLLEVTTPGINKLKDKTTEIIGSWLRGEVPKDVQTQFEKYNAARSSQLGGLGTSFTGAFNAESMGTTSYAIQQQGVGALSRWLEQSRGGVFDFSKMFAGVEDSDRRADSTWNRDWLAAQVKAAPDPQARGGFDSAMSIIGMVAGIWGGNSAPPRYQSNYGGGDGGGSGPGDSNAKYMSGRSSFFNQQERDVNVMAPMGSWG